MSRFTRLRSGRQIPLHGYTREHLSTRVRRAYREEVDRTHRSLLNAALAFAVTFGLVRALTYAIRLDLLPWGTSCSTAGCTSITTCGGSGCCLCSGWSA